MISSFRVSAMISALPDLLDAALHVKVVFRDIVVLAVEDLLERAHRVPDRHLPSFASREHLRRAERLAEETLNLARTEDGLFVFWRQLVHPEDRDDVLEVLESLQHLLHAASGVVVLLSDDLRGEGAE